MKSFKDAETGVKRDFADSAAGTILGRNLEFIDPEIFTQQYAELTFLSSGIEVNNTGGFAEVVTKIKRRVQGEFANSDDTSGNKGRISIGAEKDTIPVLSRTAHSTWADDEVKQSELEGRNLVSELVEGHNEVYSHDIDRIGYLGQTDSAGNAISSGLLNHAGFATGAAAGAVETLTGEAAYQEFADLITAQWAAVGNNEVLKADTVTMPTSVYNHISGKILNAAGSEMTVLSALQKNFPSVTFNATGKAETVGAGSVTVAYSSNRRAMVMRIPQPLQVGEIVKPGSFEFRVDSRFRIAGLDVIENEAGQYLTGL